MKTKLLMILIALLALSFVNTLYAQCGENDAGICDTIRIECPTQIDAPYPDSIGVPVYLWTDRECRGYSLGFTTNSPDLVPTSVSYIGSVISPVAQSFVQLSINQANRTILIGWADFTFGANAIQPIAGSEAVLLATIYFQVDPSAVDQTIDIDSLFVPPAGPFVINVDSREDPTQGTFIGISGKPQYVDCGAQDVIIGTGGSQNNPPTAICIDLDLDANGNCQADGSVDNGSFDPDEGDQITITQVPGGPYGLGATPVLLIVSDLEGLADTCNAVVTVNDVTPPVVDCGDTIVVNNDPGQCGAIVEYTGVTATDNCEVAGISYNPVSGSFLPLGNTEVEVVATDVTGNADTCFLNVVVQDNEPPSLTCPDDIDVNTAGDCGVVVNFEIVASDLCGEVTLAVSHPSGSTFSVGETDVTVTATDEAGNSQQCTFKVTVTDLELPVVTCSENIEVDNTPGQQDAVVEYSSSVEDNCPEAVVICTPSSSSVFPLGETTVTCVGTDASGNVDSCEFMVTVNFVNSAPIALDTNIITNQDIPVPGAQLQAYDLDGDDLDYNIVAGPFNGVVSGFDADLGTFTYTPSSGYVGADSLTFTATDGTDVSNLAVVHILVSGGGKATLLPAEQYVYYAFAITPFVDTIYFGNFPDGYLAADVNLTTVRVNDLIVPTTSEILSGYAGFAGEVVCVSFPLPPFLNPYGPLFDSTEQVFAVSGEYDDLTQFVINATFTAIGKNSQTLQFIVPKDVVGLAGDCDRSGNIDISDAVFLTNYIFGEGGPPIPWQLGDNDCSGSIDIGDAVRLVNYIFVTAPRPGRECYE